MIIKVWREKYTENRIGCGNDILIGSRCYTDGSKMKYGKCSGVCMKEDDKVIKTRALCLAQFATAYQAELQAIRLSWALIKGSIKTGEQVTIMSDSQAAFKVLENPDTTSKLVFTDQKKHLTA